MLSLSDDGHDPVLRPGYVHAVMLLWLLFFLAAFPAMFFKETKKNCMNSEGYDSQRVFFRKGKKITKTLGSTSIVELLK